MVLEAKLGKGMISESWENYLKIGINEIKPLEDSVKKIISLL